MGKMTYSCFPLHWYGILWIFWKFCLRKINWIVPHEPTEWLVHAGIGFESLKCVGAACGFCAVPSDNVFLLSRSWTCQWTNQWDEAVLNFEWASESWREHRLVSLLNLYPYVCFQFEMGLSWQSWLAAVCLERSHDFIPKSTIQRKTSMSSHNCSLLNEAGQLSLFKTVLSWTTLILAQCLSSLLKILDNYYYLLTCYCPGGG